jgi:intraflagellar transport protein 122
VSPSRDGAFIATGGADKTVSVWNYELSQKYTYTHADSIQAVVFNPVAHAVMASCSSVDFAIWTMPSSSLRKIKVPSKILCAAWTTDGQYLAMGMLSGVVSIRDMSGVEKMVIERPAPVWDISFNPSRDESAYDVLTLACWDGSLSLYHLSGQQIGKDKPLGYDPCTVRRE